MSGIFNTIIALMLLGLSSLQGASVSEEPSAVVGAPDPLSLDKVWWSYYEVPPEQLQTHINDTKVLLSDLKNRLDENENKDIYQTLNRLDYNLDLYWGQIETESVVEPSQLLFLKEYSVEQLLQVNKSLQTSKVKLAHLREKQVTDSRKLTRLLNKLDKERTVYNKAPASSILKLRSGLNLIDLRFEQAILENEIKRTKSKIHHLELETTRLEEELLFAQSNLVFNPSSKVELEEKMNTLSQSYEKSILALEENKKEAFYETKKNLNDELTCCYWDYKVLKYSIESETLRVKFLISNLELILYEIHQNKDEYTISEIQKSTKPYLEEILEAKSNIAQWETMIKQEQTHIGKQVDIAMEENSAEKELVKELITDISIEISQAQAGIEEIRILIVQFEFLIQQINRTIIKDKSFYEAWYIISQDRLDQIYQSVENFFSYKIYRHETHPITVHKVFVGLIIILISMVFSRVLKAYINTKKSIFKKVNSSTKYILERCVNHLCFLLGILFALSYIGFDFTNFIIIAGALGVGIGFGLQSVVNNILSGFFLLFQRNIKVGDIVELETQLIGRVIAINLQNTRIHSFEGIDLIVPNYQLTNRMLNNWTLDNSCRRFRVPFHVGIDVDKDKVKQISLEACKGIEAVKKNDPRFADPQLWIMGFTEYGIDFELVVWVDLSITLPQGMAKATVLWEVETALKKHGISISYPRRDIYVHEPGVQKQTNLFETSS